MKNSTQHPVISSLVAHRLWQWGLVVLLAMALSGCDMLGAKGNNPLNAAANAAIEIPAEVKESKTMLEVSVLASLSRANPFATLLVKPEDPNASTEQTAEAEQQVAPPQSPFDGFSLGGIIYRDKKPLAILGLPGGKSKIIHVGDVLQTAVEPIKVSHIRKNSVGLAVASAASALPTNMQKKVLNVASLIGYQGSKASTSASTPAASGGAAASAPAAAASGNSASATPPAESDNNFMPDEIKSLLKDGKSAPGNGLSSAGGN